MKVVLDTNVLVSGLLSPYGPSADALRLVAAGQVRLCYDARILAEYEQVLRRPRFAFDLAHVRVLLREIAADGDLVQAVPLRRALPDPDDEPFLAVALAGPARCLVTGNGSHYPTAQRQGMQVLTPAQFVEWYRTEGGAQAGR